MRILSLAVIASLTLTLSATAAFADDTEDTAASVTESGAQFDNFQKGTKGIATAFPTGGDVVANGIYFLDPGTALNVGLGLTVATGGGGAADPADPMAAAGGDDTVIGFSVRAGYRKLKPLSGRIRPYLEPQIIVGVDSLSELGDTLTLGAGAQLGVELMLLDQFTLGTGVGAALTTSQSFDSIALGLNTANITASFYWQ